MNGLMINSFKLVLKFWVASIFNAKNVTDEIRDILDVPARCRVYLSPTIVGLFGIGPFILYNKFFKQSIIYIDRIADRNDLVWLFLVAHEIGHHIDFEQSPARYDAFQKAGKLGKAGLSHPDVLTCEKFANDYAQKISGISYSECIFGLFSKHDLAKIVSNMYGVHIGEDDIDWEAAMQISQEVGAW